MASSVLRGCLVRLAVSFLLFCSSAFAAEAKCPTSPFAVPLRNCTFDTGVVSWGVLVEAGTPGQRLCLVPSTVVNSTLVSQQSLCAVSDPYMSKLECESLRGGFFNENQSTTWQGSSFEDFNSTRNDPTWAHFNPPGVTKVGYDTLYLPGGDERTFWGYGLALNQIGNNSNAGMLGLGIDSAFLDTAVKKNITPSRGWSLYSGSQSQARPRNGEIVFGGYNQGKLDGTFRWKNVSDMSGDRPCPLRTTITEMYITLENGTQLPLKSSSEQIAACVEPYDNLFRFTPGMLLNWKQITGFDEDILSVYAPGNAQNLSFTEYGLPYSASTVFPWSLTISLDNGYTTTLPGYELQAPLRGWNRLGERKVVPDVVNVAILNQPTGEGEIPTLGKIFLSQSYLAVDYDNRRFGLARAALESNPTKLVPFACAQSPSSAIASDGSEADKTPIGLIVGPAVGGGVALILVLAAIIFLVRRRRNKKKATGAGPTANRPSLAHMTSYTNSHMTYPSMSEGWQDRTGRGSVPGYPLPSPSEVAAHQRVMQWESGSLYHTSSRQGSPPPPPFGEHGQVHEIGEMGTSPPMIGVAKGGEAEIHELSGTTDPKFQQTRPRDGSLR